LNILLYFIKVGLIKTVPPNLLDLQLFAGVEFAGMTLWWAAFQIYWSGVPFSYGHCI